MFIINIIMESNYLLAADFGGTNLRFAIYDLNDDYPIFRWKKKTKDSVSLIVDIQSVLEQARKEYGIAKIE